MLAVCVEEERSGEGMGWEFVLRSMLGGMGGLRERLLEGSGAF